MIHLPIVEESSVVQECSCCQGVATPERATLILLPSIALHSLPGLVVDKIGDKQPVTEF